MGYVKKCKQCGKKMVLRDSKNGPFWGCSGYPKCHYSENYQPREIRKRPHTENPSKQYIQADSRTIQQQEEKLFDQGSYKTTTQSQLESRFLIVMAIIICVCVGICIWLSCR